jgi:7-cyano-7-deazaguanine reductase
VTDLEASPLGRPSTYGDRYDPALLFAVDRAPQRAELGLDGAVPFHGEDVWTAYELSWLDASAKPHVAIATLRVPAHSPRIVESKSMKLYLTAFNQTRFASVDAVQETLARDLAEATGAPVAVSLALPAGFAALPHAEVDGRCLDHLPVAAEDAGLACDALRAGGARVDERLFTRLFRSVCPVTGQPDFACVGIDYSGPRIDAAGLLRYLVSFRRHPGFHEHCVERIFVDVLRRCAPKVLAVHARFTRRGGIDINPYRSSVPLPPPANVRTARQ